jgi:PTS system ascorbate-specific IIB component
MKIIAACGAGMGTSMIIKIKITKIMEKLGIDATIEALSLGQAKGQEMNADVIICSLHLEDQFIKNKKAKIVAIKNIMDDNELEAGIKSIL